MNDLLVTRGLCKQFGRKGSSGVGVLSNLNFTLKEEERVAVLGKSGAGKSTLLHIFGTLERPSSGQVFFQGKEIFSFSEEELAKFRNQQIGFVFQFHYLMLEFNALENVMMPAIIGGVPRAKAKNMASDILKRVGLADRLTHKPGQLSGGEQQRVAIARALLMRPRLLLTDEMTGNLDSATGQQVMDLISELHKEYGMAMVSVTHDEILAATYPRVMKLTQGKLVDC